MKTKKESTQCTDVPERAKNTHLYAHHGFTLVEVMISMVVLLIGMLGVMGMQYYAIGGNASSRELGMATNLSVEVIERLKSTT